MHDYTNMISLIQFKHFIYKIYNTIKYNISISLSFRQFACGLFTHKTNFVMGD